MEALEITHKEIRELFVGKRRRDSQKGDFGRVLVIAGSKGMAGAAVLCARGALRAGAGLVTVSVPEELLNIVQTAVPEATCTCRICGSPDSPGGSSDSFFDTLLFPERLAVFDAIAIGPGLGISPASHEIVLYILENYGGKVVLDADALNIIAGSNITLDTDSIITPHPGEASRLLGMPLDTVQAAREQAAIALSQKFECTAVLKGAGTLVAVTNPATGLYINTTGNPGMATGGSGDVLTGVIAAFAAQGLPSLTAARAGVYVHGFAGDLMAAEFGESGLIASDLPFGVAKALKQISS